MRIKKYITLTLAAALALSAVSCGKTEEAAVTEVAEETTAESTTEDEYDLNSKLESAVGALDELEMPDFDRHAGINMKAEPLPETAAIPDDWHEVSNGIISFMVPADVEYEHNEFDLGNGKTYKSDKAQGSDKYVTIMFYDGNDWSAEEEEDEDEYQIDDADLEAARKELDEKGYPEEGYISDEKTAEYLAEMGFDYDSTRESEYRALLEFNEDMRTDDNEEAFEYLAVIKAETFGMAFPRVYYTETDGKPVYIHEYPGIYFDPSESADKQYKSMWIGAFASPDMEYTALVRGHDKAEALQIASTIKIIG